MRMGGRGTYQLWGRVVVAAESDLAICGLESHVAVLVVASGCISLIGEQKNSGEVSGHEDADELLKTLLAPLELVDDFGLEEAPQLEGPVEVFAPWAFGGDDGTGWWAWQQAFLDVGLLEGCVVLPLLAPGHPREVTADVVEGGRA